MNRFFVFLLLVIPLFPGSAVADVWWQWSFDTESGLFRTDGTVADTAGANAFQILDFWLLESGQGISPGSLSGGEFTESQPTQGFQWSGTGATEFSRSSGSLTNGSNFFTDAEELFYGFGPNEGGGAFDSALERVDPAATLATGPLTLIPLGPIVDLPDALVGKKINPARQKGNDIYNATGAGQKTAIKTQDKKKVRFYFTVQLDSPTPTSVRLNATKGNRKFRTVYRLQEGGNWQNITAKLNGAGEVLVMPPAPLPGNSRTVRTDVKPKTKGQKKKRAISFSTESLLDANWRDSVTAKVKVKR